MITNYTKLAYRNIQTVKLNESKPVKKSKGLLAPMANSISKNKNTLSNEPAYRVAKYFKSIRNIRMELKNNGNKDT